MKEPWSKFHNTLIKVCDCKREFGQDINSIWIEETNGNYFGDYCMSGITPITPRLANELINKNKEVTI